MKFFHVGEPRSRLGEVSPTQNLCYCVEPEDIP